MLTWGNKGDTAQEKEIFNLKTALKILPQAHLFHHDIQNCLLNVIQVSFWTLTNTVFFLSVYVWVFFGLIQVFSPL